MRKRLIQSLKAETMSFSRPQGTVSTEHPVVLDSSKGKGGSRLEDYLDDKFQTSADLACLSSLIASVETQKLQLEAQLQNAKTKLAEARLASTDHTDRIRKQTREFEKQHEDVQKRLMVVAASDSPDEAVERLTLPMEKLRRLEMAATYVDLLKDVNGMVVDARGHLPENPKEALKPYTRLKQFAIALRALQEPAEGAGVHMVDYVESMSTRLWTEMRNIMSDEFEGVLNKLHWPQVAMEPTTEWIDCFKKLLELQTPEIYAAQDPIILLPLGVLAKDFVLQFRFHFMCPKPTNLPEYLGSHFFRWVIGLLSKWETFFKDNVGPQLANHFRGGPFAKSSVYVDSVAALITALLPILEEKINGLLIEIHNSPHYLSRFIAQILNFDESLRQEFNYDGGDVELGWKGLSWNVLEIWFDDWMKAEKSFAFDRYHEIVEAPGNGVIDYDSTESGKTKPTHAAVMIADLLISITSQYNKLRKFSHKLRFLLHLQLKILDRYHQRLTDANEKYHALTSIMGRTVHGFTKEEQTAVEGIGGLEILCKIIGSADHIIHTLQDLANDGFFVELWDDLQKTAIDKRAHTFIAGRISFEEVRDITSRALGTEDYGSVFDETIALYFGIRSKAEEYLVQAMQHSFPAEFRSYIHKAQWTTVGDEPLSDDDVLGVTPELDQPLQSLKAKLGFLRKTLSYAIFLRVCRVFLDSLQNNLWNEILMKQDFTALGAARFRQDFRAIQTMIDFHLKPGSVRLNMPKLADGIQLLSLPIVGTEGSISLKEADTKIYSSIPDAVDVLSKLGLVHIQPSDARSIMQRRLETAE